MDDFEATYEEVTEQMNFEYVEEGEDRVIKVEDGLTYDVEDFLVYEEQ